MGECAEMKMHSEGEAPDKSRSSLFVNFPGHWSHFNQERRSLDKTHCVSVFGQIVPSGLNHCETNEEEHL